MPEHSASAPPPGAADVHAVREALLRLRESDELLGVDQDTRQERPRTSEVSSRTVRRALVDELIGFLDAREDLFDLQARSGLDPLELLAQNDAEDL